MYFNGILKSHNRWPFYESFSIESKTKIQENRKKDKRTIFRIRVNFKMRLTSRTSIVQRKIQLSKLKHPFKSYAWTNLSKIYKRLIQHGILWSLLKRCISQFFYIHIIIKFTFINFFKTNCDPLKRIFLYILYIV